MKKKELLIQYKNSIRKRNSNLWIFGAWNGDKFADNPKYFFLYCLKIKEIRAIWITKSKDVYNYMQSKEYPVYMADSSEGISIQKEAGVAIYCLSVNDLNPAYIGGALLINLWHGIPLKKIGFDDYITQKDSSLKRFLRAMIHKVPYRNTYIVATSPTIKEIYKSAFKKGSRKILDVGQSRNDMFFDDDYSYDFDFSFLNNRKAIVYMPTHRNEGKNTINIAELFDLEIIDSYCEKYNYVFIIKKHYYHSAEGNDYTSNYKNIIDITNSSVDAQELMKQAQILITDYSSCYIDYLLLNRPIYFYNYDFQDYLLNDREMYFEYDEVTPGVVVNDRKEISKHLCDWMERGVDGMSEKRKECLQLFYGNHLGTCSTLLFKEIRKIQGKQRD